MTLLPGDSANYHSRILMWGEANIHDGAEFGWNPPTTVSADTCGDWPYPNVATLLSDSTWNPQANIFCAGHAQLATETGLLTVGATTARPNSGFLTL